jgi:hypothetical protein
MQRNRNNEVQIVVCRDFAYSFKGKKRKREAQVCVPIIFKGVDQISNGAIIEKVCSGGIKMRRLDSARTAAVVVAGSDERNAAAGAERR